MTARVFFFTDSSGFGGAERSLLTIMAGLDRRCWQPALVYHPATGVEPLVEAARALGVALHPVPPMPDGREGARRLPSFVRQLRAWKPAVFHAHLVWPLAGKFGLMAALLARVPAIVATEHLFIDYRPPILSRLQHQLIAGALGRFLAVSHDLASHLRQQKLIPSRKLQVIHNGISLAAFDAPQQPRPRAKWAGAKSQPVVLTCARLNTQKGHRYLLEAATLVPGARFVLAGDGPERPALVAQAEALGIRERVCFLGYRTDVTALLQACDLFVLPSLNEGLPLSVLEAMGARRPVIATDVGGLREVIVSGESGLLVPPAQPYLLASAIRALLDDPRLAQRLAHAGRARIEREFSSEVMVDRVTRVYRELLDRRGVSHGCE